MRKLGHQAPKHHRINRFNSVELSGDFAYCKSHNFTYDTEVQNRLLHLGMPCHYTDNRYIDTVHNYFMNCYIHWTRFKDISLKAAIRKILACRNIPKGTIVNFNKSWYRPKYMFDESYRFKIRNENRFDPQYEVNVPSFSANFTNCENSKDLVIQLRAAGFLVSVKNNSSFIGNMMNTAILMTGDSQFIDTNLDGEIATAYGHGLRIGFSSFDNDYNGYSNGCDNILWDQYDEFNKWSQCNEISKSLQPECIVNKLLQT